MKIVLDTNVLISGIFFSGPPSQILAAWQKRKIQFVASADILDEYIRVVDDLSDHFPDLEASGILEVIAANIELVMPEKIDKQICDDPEDDKFFACALAGKAKIIVSGDKHLLRVKGYRGVKVLSPRDFLDTIMKK
jgi:uncharacterized protein